MKKVLLVLALILVCSSCAPEYMARTNYLDYSFFKERDFFITETNTVSFPYESLGSVYVVVRSGRIYKPTNKKGNSYNKPLYQRGSKRKEATVEDAYQLVYNQAREKGANGILGFKIEYMEPTKYKYYKKWSNYGYKITGMAIKK